MHQLKTAGQHRQVGRFGRILTSNRDPKASLQSNSDYQLNYFFVLNKETLVHDSADWSRIITVILQLQVDFLPDCR